MKCADNKLRKRYPSSHMRSMAGFLIRARALARERKIEELVDAPLNEFICPKYFDLVAEAALLSSAENDDFLEPSNIVSPSVANKIGADILKIANTKLCFAMSNQDESVKTICVDFMKMYEIRWFLKVRFFSSNYHNDPECG